MVFTHLFFAIWLYWFQVERTGGRVVTWAYPLSMIVWANLHGGFAIGLAWLAALIVADSGHWKTWLTRLGTCLAADAGQSFRLALVELHPARVVFSAAGASTSGRRVSWWPDPLVYPGYKLLGLLVMVALALLLWRKGWRGLDRTLFVLILGAFVLSLTSGRHTSLFGEVVGALLPSLVPAVPARPEASPTRPLVSATSRCAPSALLIPLYAALIVFPGDGLRLKDDPASCPVQAVSYLRSSGVTGRLLVPFNYGSYAMWQLRGQMRVSMDGRYDLVYKEATYRRVNDFFPESGPTAGP